MSVPKCKECKFHTQLKEGFPHRCNHLDVWKPVDTQKSAYIPSRDIKPSPCWCPIRLEAMKKPLA